MRDIEENQFAVEDTALKFKRADISSLTELIMYAAKNQAVLKDLARKGQQGALN